MKDSTEKTFFKDDLVLVTSSRFVIGSKTYAMRNISSVSIHELKESNKKTLGAIVTAVGIIILISSSKLLGLLAFCLGLFLILNKEFCVRINSNSGEANEMVSRDREYVQKIVNSINEAIIYRG